MDPKFKTRENSKPACKHKCQGPHEIPKKPWDTLLQFAQFGREQRTQSYLHHNKPMKGFIRLGPPNRNRQ